MKFLIFSDIHIGEYKAYDDNGSRLDNCLRALYEVFEAAYDNGITHILFCGDLYDQQKRIPTIVINNTIELFDSLFERFPEVRFIAISGNHDHSSKNTSDHEAITALHHLETVFPNNFILIDNKVYQMNNGIEIAGIPYYSHKEDFQEQLQHLKTTVPEAYLMIHQTPEHSNKMIRSECRASDFDFPYTFCGHIHKHEQLSDTFVIVGSPLHRDLGDEGQDKGYLIFDTDTNTYTRKLLDFPKFTRDTSPDTDDYNIAVVEHSPEEEIKYPINAKHEDLVKTFAEEVDLTSEFLKAGLELLRQ